MPALNAAFKYAMSLIMISIFPAATLPAQSSPQETTTVLQNKYAPELPNLKVKLGDEILFEKPEYTNLIRGKRVGLITNPTGMDSHFVSTIDKLAFGDVCKLTALFGPEHGIRGDADAGEHVNSSVDEKTGVPVNSLYGKYPDGTPRAVPNAETLASLDVMIYDLQDIGNRSYTYVTTMKNCMKAAAAHNKTFIVLDRPNPMGGNFVDGNVLDEKFVSTVGWAPVAYLYGMTCGETARWMKDYLKLENLDLHVVPMEGWTRGMTWMDTGLPWIPTSTHMPHAETCWHIALTGTFGELHTLNEGVGYTAPFEYIGAPFIKSNQLADELNSRRLPGVFFRPVHYKPYYGTYKTEMCGGVQVMITDYSKVRPVEASVHVIEAINKLYPDADILNLKKTGKEEKERVQMFTKVMGTDQVRNDLAAGKSAAEIVDSWKAPREKFVEQSRKFYLYK
jgi:uncharacterized protein YbbC (DUF1343 family)